MDWLQRLNRGPTKIDLGGGVAEILNWSHSPALVDNVPHRHTFFEICLVGSHGHGRFTAEGRAHGLRPGTLFIARPGALHQIVNQGAPLMELFWVSLGLSLQRPNGEHQSGEAAALLRYFADSPTVLAHDTDLRITKLWHALRGAAEGPARLAYDLQARSAIAALLLAIAQAGAGPLAPAASDPPAADPAAALARVAVQYMSDNLDRPLPITEVAAHLHISPRHLTRLLKGVTGLAPAAYLEVARIDRARGLLLHSGASIKEIALRCGYFDVHHFTRVFTRRAGCPPGEFRARGHAAAPDTADKLRRPGSYV